MQKQIICITDRTGRLKRNDVESELDQMFGECHPFVTIPETQQNGLSLVLIRIKWSFSDPPAVNHAIQEIFTNFEPQYKVTLLDLDSALIALIALKERRNILAR